MRARRICKAELSPRIGDHHRASRLTIHSPTMIESAMMMASVMHAMMMPVVSPAMRSLMCVGLGTLHDQRRSDQKDSERDGDAPERIVATRKSRPKAAQSVVDIAVAHQRPTKPPSVVRLIEPVATALMTSRPVIFSSVASGAQLASLRAALKVVSGRHVLCCDVT
jgi:hypothetical protein